MAYTTGRGLRLNLERALSSGGEGSVHGVAGVAGQIAKLYHPAKLHGDGGELASKLDVMLAYPPDDPMIGLGHRSLAWPESIILADGRFAGYLMPRIRYAAEIVEFYNPTIRRQRHPDADWKRMHAIARNLSVALVAVHARRHVVGDLNQGNILVTNAGLVTLIDTDSFQILDPRNGHPYLCKVGKGEFIPPELQGLRLSEVVRTSHQDAFGLAVLIFQLLMEGYHPFTSVVPAGESLPGLVYVHNIRHGNFPYDPASPSSPPPGAPNYEMLHPRLRALFHRCFVDGHVNPTVRPAAYEWYQALNAVELSLVRCQAGRHWKSPHQPVCPWCWSGQRGL